MGKQVVTIDEMIDLAIGTPESAVNFSILQKLLKIIVKYCCRMDSKFEIDMDNMKAEVTAVEYSKSSSFESGAESAVTRQTEELLKDHDVSSSEQVAEKNDNNVEDNEKKDHIQRDDDDQEHSSESKQSKSSDEKDSEFTKKEGKKKEKNESDRDKRKDDLAKKSSEKLRRRSSETHERKEFGRRKSTDSDSTIKQIQLLEDLTNKSEIRTNDVENRTSDLENQLKEMAHCVETITQTIASHLNDKHLADINDKLENLTKNIENTTDQCYEVTNAINDQSSQIQEIVAIINNIQLKKVENDELIDLLSGKADHSFVNDKVSTGQFEETIQELRDIINESKMQMDTVRVETHTSQDEIKQDLLTKLSAEEFDAAKIKIYKEIIKLTERQELILAQQNEHVAAGAKMRNLNCFSCNSDVVMLLEQETIPKFRSLKASLQPLEPLNFGSKINIGKNASEWKHLQLKARDFTRNSKAPRFISNVIPEKSTYVQGRNGYIYKGNVGCDCVEGMNSLAHKKNDKCCEKVCCNTIEANNMKNVSDSTQVKSTSKISIEKKIIENMEVDDSTKSSSKIVDIGKNIVPEQVCTEGQENKINTKMEDFNEVEPTIETTLEEATTVTEQPTVENEPSATEEATEKIKNEEQAEVINNLLNESVTTKIENEAETTISKDQDNNISNNTYESNAILENNDEVVTTEAEVEDH